MDNQSYTSHPFIKLHGSLVMLTVNPTEVLKGTEDFSIQESFSYKLAKWNLMDKPRASKKVQLSKMTEFWTANI